MKILLVLLEVPPLKAVPANSVEQSVHFWLLSGQSAVGNLSENGPETSRIGEGEAH